MKIGGRIPWNATPICETFKISYLMGRLHMKRRFGVPFNGPVIPFGAMQNITVFLFKTCRDCINSVQESCQVHSLDMRCTRRESGKETLKNWRRGTHLKSMVKDSMQKSEMLTPMRGEKLIFPIADGSAKIYGGDQDLRTSTLIRESPARGEEGNLPGESDGSSSTSRQDSSWYGGEAIKRFSVYYMRIRLSSSQ